MAQRELAVVLRDVDLGTWRPPRPDPAPAKNANPTFHEFASDWFAAKQLEIEQNTAKQLRERPHQPPAAVLQGPPPLRDHGGRGRPLPPEQGARSRRDHGGRRERDADDGVLRRSSRPRPTVAARAPFRRARSTCTSICWRRSSRSPSTTAVIDEQSGGRQAPPPEGLEAPARSPRQRRADRDPARGRQRARSRRGRYRRQPTATAGPGRSAIRSRRPAAARRIATLLLGGGRASATGAMLWRDVDLANGRFEVGRDKTDAGMREVDMLPLLREILTEHKAASERTGPDDPVFVTSTGKPRSRHNLRQDVVDAVVDPREPARRGARPAAPAARDHPAQAAAHVRLDPGRDRQGPDLRDAAARAHRPRLHAARLRPRDAPQRGGARAAQGARPGPRLGSEWAVKRPIRPRTARARRPIPEKQKAPR